MCFFKSFSKRELIITILISAGVLAAVVADEIVYSIDFSSESQVEADRLSDKDDVADSYIEPATETTVSETTEVSTEAVTELPTVAATEPVTEAPTEAPTEAVTEPPTEPPTEPVTEPPTVAPTEPVTEAPTVTPTVAPTEAPTVAPTEAPTVAVVQPVYNGELIELPQAEWETEIVSIMLEVPDYKQYDSRWCDKYIATKTIGTVGCLVTSLSQVYSYNNGVEVYPDGMLSMVGFYENLLEWYTVPNVGLKYTLKYKASINLNIMNNIYKRLKEGRPVIVGGTNTNGGMHWIVVKGYNVNATGTMEPANFVINDPGGTKRITLADFLLEYPRVERLVY